MPKKRSPKKTQKKRLVKRTMKGCAKKQNGGQTPTFQVGISKFYPMNELASDVQRNITVDRGPIVGGKRSKRRYSRKYLDPMRKAMHGGYLQELAPLNYNQSSTSPNPGVQPIIQKFQDTNPYLV
jgi:hypothetical protein